jgi:hypothetical protein
MHGVLMRHADALVGCIEGSEEEADPAGTIAEKKPKGVTFPTAPATAVWQRLGMNRHLTQRVHCGGAPHRSTVIVRLITGGG